MKTLQLLFSGRAVEAEMVTAQQRAVLLLLLCTASASAGVRYVDATSASPTPPYTTWATAARVIQDAVDAAGHGDEIVVTNGTYATGGRAVGTNQLVNRVAVDKPLTVRSVNGPEVTVIQGYQVPGNTNGDGAIRCVYLANGASLSGFTLSHGATRRNGDWHLDQSGGGVWCESTNALVSNCVVVGNSAGLWGGGAHRGTLSHCTLAGNSAGEGGGAAFSVLNNCTIISNSAHYGGGAVGGTLSNCTLTRNSAWSGGGMSQSTLNNCALTANSARFGGGACAGTLNNCTLTGNSAEYGGGVEGDEWWGHSTMNNCIVYFNNSMDGANWGGGSVTLNYCCTTPLPADGTGNISLNPQLFDAAHLGPDSPCQGAASAAYTTGTDIDGEAWASPPSIGCDEYHPRAAAGQLSVTVLATFTNVLADYSVGLTALIEGHASLSVWDFGDGLALTNRPYTAHAWTTLGDYAVVLRAYNESNPGGVSATATVHVVAQPVYYVAAHNITPVPPYTSWATAATNIQEAVDAADVISLPPGSVLVLVTNGIYAAGGRKMVGTITNRVVVDKPLIVRSVNGPDVTVIQGYMVPGTINGDSAIRCVYLANGASLSGFTLSHGATRTNGDWHLDQSGGGLWCESTNVVVSNCVLAVNWACYLGGGAYQGTLNQCTLTGNFGGRGGGASWSILNNCTLTSNSASSGGGAAGDWNFACRLNNCTLTGNSAFQSGGGACQATLNSCVLTGNSASGDGGGASQSTLNNCTLSGNSALECGGVSSGTLNNCILYFNTAKNGANYCQGWGAVFNFCCTTLMPTNGVGNITNAPLFVDYAGGDLRLQPNSPCINAGHNAYAPRPTDLDANPRIVSGTVDIGAYEFQGLGSMISYAWLQQFGLPTDGSADAADPDADGHNTWQEWRCQTCPTNALSVLRLLSGSYDDMSVTLTWQSVAGVDYFLECSTNLAATPSFTPLATNLPGHPGTTSYTDTNAMGAGPFFYRVSVGN